uniref:Tudor domain-containing protein n=1 Tax=Macrostomum lignano TaxID=282301 RepID=A0A1I8IPD9_9PLAT
MGQAGTAEPALHKKAGGSLEVAPPGRLILGGYKSETGEPGVLRCPPPTGGRPGTRMTGKLTGNWEALGVQETYFLDSDAGVGTIAGWPLNVCSNMNTIPTGRHLCACTNFKSPRSFHVQLRDDGGSGLRMLTKDLIKHHRSMQNVEIQPVLQPGRLVCAFQPDTGLAYRARVLPPNNYLSSVSVETLDFGEQLKFSAADLTPLPDELADRMPPQAVHCRLAGLGNSWPEVASSSLAERMLELESGADEEADDVKLWVEFPAATAETPVPVELSSEQGEQLNPWFLSLSGVQPEERPSPAAAVTDNGDNPWFAADVSHVTDDDGQLLVHLLKRSDRRKLDQLAADLDAFLRSAPLMSPPSPPPPSAAVRQVLFVARLPQRGPVRIRFEASAAAVSRRLLRLVDFGCTVVDLAAVPSLEPLPLDHPLAKLDPFCIACRPVSAAAKEVSTVGAAVSVNLLSLADAHRLIWLADLRPLEPGIPPYAAASRLKVGQTQPALLCWLDPATGTGRFLLRDDRRHLRRLADKLPGQDVSPATPPLPAGTPVMLAATPTAPARRATLLMELPDGAGPESHCRLLLVDYGVEVVAKLAELTVAPRTVASTPAWSLTARLANFGQADFPTGQLQCGRLTVVSVSLGSTVEVSFSPDLSLLPELLHALKPASNSKKHSPTAETVGLPAAYPVRTPVKGRDSCVVLHADHAASLHILMDCDAAIAKRIADRLSRYRPPARPGRGGGDQADNAEDNFPRDSACLAMDQRDACWRRALVLSQGESGGHYLVRLVDTGRLACLPGSLLAPLPDSLAEQPPCALHCSLANLQPGELAGPSVIASLRKLIGRPAIRVDEQTRLEELHELLQERAADQPALSAAELTVGTPCIALYEEDWYRARIVEPADAAGRLRVRFVDYGNESFGSAADELRVRRVPVSAAGVPALAAECRLRPPAGRRFADGCAAKLIALGEEDDGGLQLRLTSPRQPEGWWRAEVLDDRAATLLE